MLPPLGKLATVLAVQPPGRYGALERSDNQVVDFIEKPRGDGGVGGARGITVCDGGVGFCGVIAALCDAGDFSLSRLTVSLSSFTLTKTFFSGFTELNLARLPSQSYDNGSPSSMMRFGVFPLQFALSLVTRHFMTVRITLSLAPRVAPGFWEKIKFIGSTTALSNKERTRGVRWWNFQA